MTSANFVPVYISISSVPKSSTQLWLNFFTKKSCFSVSIWSILGNERWIPGRCFQNPRSIDPVWSYVHLISASTASIPNPILSTFETNSHLSPTHRNLTTLWSKSSSDINSSHSRCSAYLQNGRKRTGMRPAFTRDLPKYSSTNLWVFGILIFFSPIRP